MFKIFRSQSFKHIQQEFVGSVPWTLISAEVPLVVSLTLSVAKSSQQETLQKETYEALRLYKAKLKFGHYVSVKGESLLGMTQFLATLSAHPNVYTFLKEEN